MIVSIIMKWTFALLLTCAAACAADLASVRSVYVLQMGNGLDQYLANHLTQMHIFQVVADPKRADAVLTDRLGKAFEARLDELYPAPKPAAPKEPEKPKTQAGDTAAGFAEAADKLPPAGMTSTFSSAKGNVFLVEAKTRAVLWSAFEK